MGFGSGQMHAWLPSGQRSLSVNEVIIGSRRIHQRRRLIHPIGQKAPEWGHLHDLPKGGDVHPLPALF